MEAVFHINPRGKEMRLYFWSHVNVISDSFLHVSRFRRAKGESFGVARPGVLVVDIPYRWVYVS